MIKATCSADINDLLDKTLPSLLSRTTLTNTLTKIATTASIKNMASSVGKEAFVRQMRSCIARADQRETLAQLPAEIPVLVCSGKEDRLIPARCMKEMHELLLLREATNAQSASMFAKLSPWRMVECQHSAHMLPLEQPDFLSNALANWVGEISIPRASIAASSPHVVNNTAPQLT